MAAFLQPLRRGVHSRPRSNTTEGSEASPRHHHHGVGRGLRGWGGTEGSPLAVPDWEMGSREAGGAADLVTEGLAVRWT